MEITKDTLQELINKRADKKATDEVGQFVALLHKSGILDLNEFTIQSPNYQQKLRKSFWSLSKDSKESPLCKLYQNLYEKYIEQETKDFVSKVESLVSQADNLLNISENFNQNHDDNNHYNF